MRWNITGTLALTLVAAHAGAQTGAAQDACAIVGARIEIGDGRVIEKGTVVVRDGRIVAVGPNVPVPPGAEIIKGDGLTVYPGFIDAHRSEGLTPPAPQANQDAPPDTASDAPASMREANRKGVRPELRAADVLGLTDALLAPSRASGWTAALLAPGGGYVNGTAALVMLGGQPARDSVVRSEVAQCFALRTGGDRFSPGQRPRESGYPGSLMGVFAQTRQALLDARRYAALKSSWDKGGTKRPPADATLAALQPVLGGALPALFEADTENEIVRALNIAGEFGLKPVLSGGAEAWKQAKALKAGNVPVLLALSFGDEPGVKPPPRPGRAPGRPGQPDAPKPDPAPKEDAQVPVKPETPGPQNPAPQGNANPKPADEDEDAAPASVTAERRARWLERVRNAAELNKAGVPFALTTRGVRTPADFWKNLRRALKEGLPREAALRALTVDAARILGVEKQMGTVEAGKIANLVVMSSDFAKDDAKVRYVFVDARKFDPERDQPARPTVPGRLPFDADHAHDFFQDDDPHGGR